jgi:two-component system, NarL family, sensor histidine kinase BarA
MSKSKRVDLMHGDVANLEELVERESLAEVCRSFFDLFGLSIRFFSKNGALLADVHEERAICRLMNQNAQGRVACNNTVREVQKAVPGETTLIHRCFTGAIYHIVPIWYSDRQLGRIVFGPFLPADLTEIPESLLQFIREDEREQIGNALAEMPRVRDLTSEHIAMHLRNILDLILFAGHQSQLMSEMHLASVREGYKSLAERNASLREAYDQLKELDRLKSNFLATVSHELRTPLTSIIGYSEMLLSGLAGELNEEQRVFTNTINSKGELLLTLITNLLDQNKFERETATLNLRMIDPKAVISEVIETVLPEAIKKGVKVKTSCPENLHYLNADPIRLKQILLNLVGNAVKFTSQDGLVSVSARSVELTSQGGIPDELGVAVMTASERGIEFEVRDTGIGISKENLRNIFDAFFRVDNSSTREYGGIGLGLSIAKKLVEAHGGTIRVESEINVGTAFFVVLPERAAQQV